MNKDSEIRIRFAGVDCKPMPARRIEKAMMKRVKLVGGAVHLQRVSPAADRAQHRAANRCQPAIGHRRIERVQHTLEISEPLRYRSVKPRNAAAAVERELSPVVGHPFFERVRKHEPEFLRLAVERGIVRHRRVGVEHDFSRRIRALDGADEIERLFEIAERIAFVLHDLFDRPFDEIATIAYTLPDSLPPDTPLGLEAQSRFTPDAFCTWSNACHICLVEVDRDTGAVEILRYVVSEAGGVMINPGDLLHGDRNGVTLIPNRIASAVAQACADTVVVPRDAGCCGFAGDRGFTHAELTASATKHEAKEVKAQTFDGYYASSRTCEIGMTRSTGQVYRSFLYLLESATRPEAAK